MLHLRISIYRPDLIQQVLLWGYSSCKHLFCFLHYTCNWHLVVVILLTFLIYSKTTKIHVRPFVYGSSIKLPINIYRIRSYMITLLRVVSFLTLYLLNECAYIGTLIKCYTHMIPLKPLYQLIHSNVDYVYCIAVN